MLNLSEARESERIFRMWSRCFLVPLYLAIILLIVGLFFFYDLYDHVAETLFPLYCTQSLSPTYEELIASAPAIFDTQTRAMVEIQAEDFTECTETSYTYIMFEQ